MRMSSTLLMAAPVIAGLLLAPAARADWHRGDWHHDWHHHDNGAAVAGAILGLGAGALIGGLIASQPQYYAPPPAVVYAPPPPVVYAPPPGYPVPY